MTFFYPCVSPVCANGRRRCQTTYFFRDSPALFPEPTGIYFIDANNKINTSGFQAQEEAENSSGWVFLQYSSPELSLHCPAFVGPSVILPSISVLDREFYHWILES